MKYSHAKRAMHFSKRTLKLSCQFLILLMFLNFFCVDAQSESGPLQYYNLALKYQRDRNFAAAERTLSMGLAKHPKSSKLYFARAKLRGNYMRKPNEAIMDYNSVITLGESAFQPKSYYMRGNLYYRIGYYQQALSDLNQCLRLNPKYGDRVYMDRAKIYAKLGMFEQARRDSYFLIKKKSKFSKSATNLLNNILSQGY